MISSLIGFLTSPLGIALLIGAFSGGARLWAKMQEQRAKQTQILARREMERDALRTGGRGQAAPSTESAASGSSGSWDQSQQTKRERIEELRRRRIEQLQKLREQRAGAAKAQASAATPVPTQTPRRAASQPQPTRRGPQRAAAPPAASSRRPAPTPMQRQAPRPAPKTAREPQRPPTPRRTPQRQPQQAQAQPAPAAQHSPITDIDIHASAHAAPTVPKPRFVIGQALRDAIIAKEVLGPPVALRNEHAADPFTI